MSEIKTTMCVQDVAALIEEIAPLSLGHPGDELGLLVGNPLEQLTGVVTCWSPTTAVLREAADRGYNMVIGHEPLTYRVCGHDVEAGLKWYDERHPTAKVPNQRRMALAFSHGIAVYRYHSNWDMAPEYGIMATLARRLGFDKLLKVESMVHTYVVEPVAVRAVAERARRAVGLGPIRLIGDPERIVSCISLCIGGFGQMFTIPEVALAHNAELAIFGEMLDYTIRYCVDSDLAAIELGHYQSEQPGIEAMAEFLRERLPADVPVECVPSGEPWVYFGA